MRASLISSCISNTVGPGMVQLLYNHGAHLSVPLFLSLECEFLESKFYFILFQLWLLVFSLSSLLSFLLSPGEGFPFLRGPLPHPMWSWWAFIDDNFLHSVGWTYDSGRVNYNSVFLESHNNSLGKESTCNAGDPSLTPGLERSAGEGIGYSLQYFWASLVV